jgi:hypothetical protein
VMIFQALSLDFKQCVYSIIRTFSTTFPILSRPLTPDIFPISRWEFNVLF